jgi:thiamine-phosphate pyrophosphorylase
MLTSARMSDTPRTPRAALHGLYAVTPDTDDDGWLFEAVAAALSGGASAVQYRNKLADPTRRLRQASELAQLCRERGVPLIVNDSIELAIESGAAGVHLGRDDADPSEGRSRLGPDALIGVSCYDSFELAERAAGIADHVAFGSLFGSRVKPGAVRAPLELLARARARGWNVVGIGGIDADNVGQAATAGADSVAVITALFDAPGTPPERVEQAARRLVEAFHGGHGG